MIEFSHIKYGVLVAMMAILFGGSLGLSFGCCEDNLKDGLKGNAENNFFEITMTYYTDYLEEISADFHSIWNKGKDNESLRFIDEKNAEKTISKIFWLESFRVVLKDIFSIIDISAPETM